MSLSLTAHHTAYHTAHRPPLRTALAWVLVSCLAAACPAPTGGAADPEPPLVLRTGEQGRFSLSFAAHALADVEAVVFLSDGSEVRLADASDLAWRSEGATHRARGSVSGVEVELTLEERGDHVRARIAAQALIDGLGLRVSGFGLRGRAPEGARGAYQEGYSSWSPVHLVTLGEGDPGEAALTGVDGDHLYADPRLSWWLGALPYDDATFASGALSARAFKSRVLTYRDEDPGLAWRLIVGKSSDSVPLGDAASPPLRSEELFLTFRRAATAALDVYGREVAAENAPPRAPFVPVGWNSWNTFFTDITPDDIAGTAAFLADTLPGLQLNTLQIDDGWQVKWGDWRENERFAGRMEELVGQLRALDYQPGIWWAPFLADVESDTVSNHPEWLLRDPRGEPVFYGSSALGYRYYVLDTSHPEVQAFVLETLDRLLGWGFRYLKLDFLFGGASEGMRFDPDVTGLMAFGALVEQMSARAQAEGAYLLACGAPILPSAGRFHALRTGDDIAFADLSYSFAMNKNAFRNVAHRFYVNHFLASDPDTVLVRDLAPDAQRLNVTAALLSGRILNLGDDVRALDPERLALLRTIQELPVAEVFLRNESGEGPRFRPLDLFEQANIPVDNKFAHILAPEDYVVPSLWYLPVDERRALLAVFNWWSEEEWREVMLPVEGAPYTSATGLYSRTALSLTKGKVSLEVPARGVRLLLLQRD